MKRFIRYLYEYEHGKRIRNVGFVKVEAGDGETTLHMQGKGFHNDSDRKLVLYLFYEENEKIIGIRKKEIELETPVLSCHFAYFRDDEEISMCYDKMNGMILETESGRRIAAAWDDRLVDVEQMVEGVVEETAVEETAVEETVVEDEAEDIAEETGRIFTKIQRKDISKLPRCEWKLANNQFLIYGYNNYHHLIVIEDGNVLKLGVPGIYHIKEAEIAERFGFREFLSIEEMNISLDEEERHQSEPFGYWCRPVRGYRNR